MNKLVQEAPFHPGYEDAVIEQAFMYKGVDPAKMIWKSKPLTEEKIDLIASSCWYEDEDLEMFNHQKFAKLIQESHGIK